MKLLRAGAGPALALSLFIAGVAAGQSSAAPPRARAVTPLAPSRAEKAAAARISAGEIQAHVRFLSSDLLDGRLPGTRGDALAQEYVAAQFQAMGLVPAGTKGSWFQPFELVGLEGNPTRMGVSGADGKKLELKHAEDFIVVAGRHEAKSRLEGAEVVFVGYGIVAPEFRWDDFKGTDLKGKVLLVMNSDPDGEDPSFFAGKARLWYGRWDYKFDMASKLGAAGVLLIHTTPSAGYSWKVVQSSWRGEQFELPAEAGVPRVQVKGWLTEEVSRKVAALGGKDLDALRRAAESKDFRPVPLGVRLETSFQNRVERRQTGNVLGMLPGSDPTLRSELIIYTAHHDHLGRRADAKPGEDAIYNGAVDNASGVATMLAVARAFKALPKAPARSILFAAVAAEEQGLLGSQYLVEHPPVEHGALAANINIDGMNIWGRTRDVAVFGLGKSNLDDALASVAAMQGRVLRPDPMADRGFFYRSDQFNFARYGVPSAYFGSGMEFVGRPPEWGRTEREAWDEAHYHQPSDAFSESWDLSGALEDAQLFFYLGLQVAKARAMPEWVPGDEFEGPRKKALAARKQRTPNGASGK